MKNLKMTGLLKSLLAAAFSLALVSTQAHAQAYPNKPIKAIVPFAAGSATDQIGKPLRKKCPRSWVSPLWLKTKPA